MPEKHFDKEKFEALEVLRKGAWDKFSSRIPHEWKACLALWALLAAFAATLLGGGKINLNCMSKICVTVLGVIMLGIHILWLFGLARAAEINQKMEHELRNKMLEEIEGNFKWSDEELKKIIEKRCQTAKAKWYQIGFYLYNWSQVTQAAMTLVLVIFVILLLWSSQ